MRLIQRDQIPFQDLNGITKDDVRALTPGALINGGWDLLTSEVDEKFLERVNLAYVLGTLAQDFKIEDKDESLLKDAKAQILMARALVYSGSVDQAAHLLRSVEVAYEAGGIEAKFDSGANIIEHAREYAQAQLEGAWIYNILGRLSHIVMSGIEVFEKYTGGTSPQVVEILASHHINHKALGNAKEVLDSLDKANWTPTMHLLQGYLRARNRDFEGAELEFDEALMDPGFRVDLTGVMAEVFMERTREEFEMPHPTGKGYENDLVAKKLFTQEHIDNLVISLPLARPVYVHRAF